MADRSSESSYDGVVEEATFAIKVKPEAMKQLSSSSEAAKTNRMKKGLNFLGEAAQDARAKEMSEGAKHSQTDPSTTGKKWDMSLHQHQHSPC